MTIAVIVNLLLGAGLLAVVLLFVAASIQVGRLLMWCERLGAALRWPAPVPGGPST
jgi:hypothetical protein